MTLSNRRSLLLLIPPPFQPALISLLSAIITYLTKASYLGLHFEGTQRIRVEKACWGQQHGKAGHNETQIRKQNRKEVGPGYQLQAPPRMMPPSSKAPPLKGLQPSKAALSAEDTMRGIPPSNTSPPQCRCQVLCSWFEWF